MLIIESVGSSDDLFVLVFRGTLLDVEEDFDTSHQDQLFFVLL